MKVALFLICHAGIAEALLETAVQIMGKPNLKVEVLGINKDDDTDLVKVRAESILCDIKKHHDVLILTDLIGSTPNNIAATLGQSGHVSVISGLNMGMLLTVFNYPQLPLNELCSTVYEGAKKSIIQPEVCL